MRRLRLLLLTVLLLAIGPSGALAEQTLGLSSGSFHFNVAAGDTVKGSVVVMNEGDEPLKVLVYGADQEVDQRGNVSYAVPSRADLTSLSKPSSWMRITMPSQSKSLGNIPYLELNPKDRVTVKFSLGVPSDVSPGDHNVMLFFEMFGGDAGGAKRATSEVSGRIGSRIRLRVSGELVERLGVAPFKVPAFVIGAKVPYDFTVNNPGNVDQRVVARMTLLNRSDETMVEQTPIRGRLVFAGEHLSGAGSLYPSKQLLGPHAAQLEVTPVDDNGNPSVGATDAITKTLTVWMVPLWLATVVGGAVFILIAWLLWALVTRMVRTRAPRPLATDATSPITAIPDAAPQPVPPATAQSETPPAGVAVFDVGEAKPRGTAVVDEWFDAGGGPGQE